MIIGGHTVLHSKDPEADRAFLRDVIGLPHVDAGGGWLIFGLPPAEVAVHPAERNDVHEFYLLCESVGPFVARMQERGVECSDVMDEVRSGEDVRCGEKDESESAARTKKEDPRGRRSPEDPPRPALARVGEDEARPLAIEERRDGASAAMSADPGRDLFDGGPNFVRRDRRQAFHDDEGAGRLLGQLRAVGFLPVPAAAEGAGSVPVDHLARPRRTRLRLSEEPDRRLTLARDRELDVPLHRFEIFRAGRQQPFEGDRVVDVHDPVDVGQALPLPRPSDEVLDR
jgi:hypothetical protein